MAKKLLTQDDINCWSNYINSKPTLNKNLLINKPIKHANNKKILDLHGSTLEQSFKMVREFLEYHHKVKSKKVKIITGKPGVIFNELPFWLEQFRFIRSFNKIYDSKGQCGSFSIFLKN